MSTLTCVEKPIFRFFPTQCALFFANHASIRYPRAEIPTEKMFELANLPLEVLGHMLNSSDHSYLFVRLWKCGSSFLNVKLAKCMTYVELEIANDFPRTLFFPRLLCQLPNLRHLSVKGGVVLVKNQLHWLDIIPKLSGKLESIELRSGQDAHHAFLNYDPNATPAVPEPNIYEDEDQTPIDDEDADSETNEEDAEADEQIDAESDSASVCSYDHYEAYDDAPITTQYERGRSQLVDVGKLFPQLHTLKLHGGRWWSIAQPAALPPTLTHLSVTWHLDYTSLPADRRLFASLPPALRTLDGYLSVRVSWRSAEQETKAAVAALHADWSTPPPHLEIVSSLDLPEYFDAGLSWLPPSMQKVNLDFGSHLPVWSSSLSNQLPSGLNAIKIIELSAEAVSQGDSWTMGLPRNLKTLKLITHGSTALNSISPHLPQGLECMELMGDDNTELSGLRSVVERHIDSCWPPTLTRLHLHYNKIKPSDLGLLPKTLLDLIVWFLDAGPPTGAYDFDGSDFPPALTKLELTASNFKIRNKLPSKLISFKLRQARMPLSLCHKLPYSLKLLVTTFDLDVPGTPDDLNLPDLTFLQVYEWHCRLFDALPRSLTTLNINRLLGCSHSKEVQRGALFEKLPSGLVRLDISTQDVFSQNFVLPHQRLSHFTCLESLSIEFWPQVPSSILPELPRSLRQLFIDLPVIDEIEAPFIPAGLRRLAIRPKLPYCSYLADHWPLRATSNLTTQRPESRKVLKKRASELLSHC